MNRFHVEASLKRGVPLAARVPARRPDRAAWVGVYPLDPSSHLTVEYLAREGVSADDHPERPICRVRYFELDADRAGDDRYFCEADLLDPLDALTFGIDRLMEVLRGLGCEPEWLEQHFKSDYPI